MLWADVMSGMFARGVMCDVRDARQDQARWLAESLRDYRRNKLVSAAPRASGRWPTEGVESRRVMSCGELTADQCEMLCVMFTEVYHRRKDLLNGLMWCSLGALWVTFPPALCLECGRCGGLNYYWINDLTVIQSCSWLPPSWRSVTHVAICLCLVLIYW